MKIFTNKRITRKQVDFILVLLLVIFVALFFWMNKMSPLEKKLCQTAPSLRVYVQKCFFNSQIFQTVYLKEESTVGEEDSGGVTYYDRWGEAICQNSSFGVDRDNCNKYLFGCIGKWKDICP